jgi:hypothetical protein
MNTEEEDDEETNERLEDIAQDDRDDGDYDSDA